MDIKRLFSPKPAAIIILAVSFGVYFNALFNGFVYDDKFLVLQNPWIRSVRHIPEMFLSNMWAFEFKGATNYYRPMFHIFYMLDFYIFGLRPWGFHLTKILFHMGSSLLVFLMASTLINRYGEGDIGTETYKQYIPFTAALLFATHPIHTEAVLGITEVSLAFFYFLSFYLYVRADVRGRGVPLSSLVFFFLAALSKETALTLPILLFAYDYSFKRDSVFRTKPETFYLLFKRYLPYLLVAGIYLILRTYALLGVAPVKAHAYLSGYEYFINVFPLFIQYLGKLILPVNLNAAYVFHPIHSLFEWRGILAVAVTVGFIVALYLVRNRNRVAFFSLLWMVIPLLPVFYIPALGENTFSERYLYLPSAGFVIVVSVVLCGIAGLHVLRSRAVPLVLPVVLVITALYSAGTIKRNPVWKDSLTLWSDTVKKSPDGHNIHNNLGIAYKDLGRIDEAIEEYREALRLNPDLAEAHNNLGLAYYNQGRTDEAIDELKKALGLRPDLVEAHNNLGLAYDSLGRTDEAIDELKKVLRLRPDIATGHYNLGKAYSKKGLTDKAIEEHKKALNLKPDYPEAHVNLGSDYYILGRIDEAIEEFESAIRLQPDYPEAHNNLGLAYDSLDLTDEAVREFKEAISLKPGFAEAHNNLGIVYARQGRMNEAIEEFRETLRLDPGLADARFNLAQAYKKGGLKDNAITEFEEYLRLNPGNRAALEILEELVTEDAPL